MSRRINACPACGANDFEIVKFRCKNCDTRIEGAFSVSRLGTLSQEMQAFIEIFIKCRGNIKDVERELGVSYPTVRGKLERVIEALGYHKSESSEKRLEILKLLESKEVTPEEALAALKELKQ